jgi:hypothetical protein
MTLMTTGSTANSSAGIRLSKYWYAHKSTVIVKSLAMTELAELIAISRLETVMFLCSIIDKLSSDHFKISIEVHFPNVICYLRLVKRIRNEHKVRANLT